MLLIPDFGFTYIYAKNIQNTRKLSPKIRKLADKNRKGYGQKVKRLRGKNKLKLRLRSKQVDFKAKTRRSKVKRQEKPGDLPGFSHC